MTSKNQRIVDSQDSWDIVYIMTQREGIFDITPYFEGKDDPRTLRFYPLTKVFKRQYSAEEALALRYEQAVSNGDIPDSMSVDEFKDPQNRLIGNTPDISRAVMLIDDTIWIGRTICACAKDFQTMGYDLNNIWTNDGNDIYRVTDVLEDILIDEGMG